MMRTSRTLWYIALPILILVACVLNAPPAVAQMTSTGIDCSQIAALHLLQQDNMRAGLTLMECGVVPRPKATNEGDLVDGDAVTPPNVLVSNRNCANGQSCTHSENMVWRSSKAGDQTVVVNYNDETNSGNNYSGVSYSLDGGATFTQITPSPFASGHGTNYGDPIVVYNQKLGKWFAGDLATGCGGQGIGMWTSPDGITWTTGACAHNNSGDDRESMWVDNNPFSAAYGRMYISYNNFNIGGGALYVAYSDDGVSWTQKQLNPSFIRDVQLTGTPPGPPPPSVRYTSTVFVATMDEGSGGLSTRQNVMYRSTDGGVTWTSVTMGARFPAVGDSTCGYFAKVNPIWRHMGWGQPAAGPNGVVHYAYAQHGSGSDNGDIYYVRSADNGVTWSTPIKLEDNSADGQYKTQWMPSVSVNYNPAGFVQHGEVTVKWYDRRQATTACNAVKDAGCQYEVYGVVSPDNGVSWGSNFAISNTLIAEPDQQDQFVQSCYAGDYDYTTAFGGKAYVTWTDGRVSVGGVNVQNVELGAVSVP